MYLGMGETVVDLEKYYDPIRGMKCLYQAKLSVSRDDIRKGETSAEEDTTPREAPTMPKFVRPDNLRSIGSGMVRPVDPNRYRPSAESLCRRAVKGLPLYRISALVDIINIVSMWSGFSIGGFDADRVQGGIVTLGVGTADDVFEGIGRGVLNIEGLPVWRDAVGGIGTPTSDHERTKLTADTTRLLMIVNAYSGHDGLPEALDLATDLLRRYAQAGDVERLVI